MSVGRRSVIACAGVVLAALAAPTTAAAQPKVTSMAEASQTIEMQVGETRLVHLSEQIIRISVADPEVADVQVVTPRQVLITAQAVGTTHLIMWGELDDSLVVSLECTRNLDQLRSQFAQLFPGQEIEVGSVGDLVVLSGSVSDLRIPARAAEVAKLYAEQFANLIEVTGDQQVQLEVRFAEVSRSALREMGLNYLWRDSARGYVGGATNPGTRVGEYLGGGSSDLRIPGTSSETGPPLSASPVFEDAFNLFFSTGLEEFPFSAILSILADEGLAKVLAEPTLVAMSGQEASFHAGGEVPILIARQLGEVSVHFKKFGVRLEFSPTVLGEGTMNLELRVEVSEPDPNSGVSLGGFQVPGFRSRSSATTVRIKDGQSFAVAGLLSEQVRSQVAKIPLLGDVPILGALFRSTAYQREETELLVVVRAHLVRPGTEEQLPLLPGEGEFTDPSDFELFLLGRLTGGPDESVRRPQRAPAAAIQGGPSGPIGFVRQFDDE